MEPSRRGGLFMNGRDVLFSAFKAVDLTTLVVGAKAAADPARRERAAIFIMVATLETGMDAPLVYQLFCQGHRWVAMCGRDKC